MDITNHENQKVKVGFGICMDIEVYEYIDPTKYELADKYAKD